MAGHSSLPCADYVDLSAPGHPRLTSSMSTGRGCPAAQISLRNLCRLLWPGMTSAGQTAGSNAMNIQDNSRYHEVHARSLADPEGFWGEVAREIDWIEPANKVFDPAMGLYGRWCAGAGAN